MKILWLTWKDLKNPLAGGAEVVNQELAARLAKDGHQVIFLVAGFKQVQKKENVDGYQIIRVGNRWTVYWFAYLYYRSKLHGWPDLVIDEINTIPFMAKFYAREKNILFIHMLCRIIWFYELPPIVGWLGYLLEPIYLKLLNDRQVITISQSTTAELIKFGFKPDHVKLISEGITTSPVKSLVGLKKYSHFTLLSLGSIRPMKQTLDQIRAFELARAHIQELRLKVAGDAVGQYGEKVLRAIQQSRFAADIEYFGKVNQTKKIKLMQASHVFLMTSVKEGWGLTVTEAASQGTPSIVYDVDGLRDSVKHRQTGLICSHNSPEALASAILLLYSNPGDYQDFRFSGWQWSQLITFDKSYLDFKKATGIL